jgi:mycoredoxin
MDQRIDMPEEKILVYGVNWCGDCRRARQFLQQNNIIFDFVNIDYDKNGESFVIKTNKGMRSVPTIVFPDGTILIEPSNRQLAKQLNIPQG